MVAFNSPQTRLDAERTRVDADAEATKREARGKHADAAQTQCGVLWRFETRADAQREAHGKRTGRRGKHTGRRGKHTGRRRRRVGRIGTHRDAQRDAQQSAQRRILGRTGTRAEAELQHGSVQLRAYFINTTRLEY